MPQSAVSSLVKVSKQQFKFQYTLKQSPNKWWIRDSVFTFIGGLSRADKAITIESPDWIQKETEKENCDIHNQTKLKQRNKTTSTDTCFFWYHSRDSSIIFTVLYTWTCPSHSKPQRERARCVWHPWAPSPFARQSHTTSKTNRKQKTLWIKSVKNPNTPRDIQFIGASSGNF